MQTRALPMLAALSALLIPAAARAQAPPDAVPPAAESARGDESSLDDELETDLDALLEDDSETDLDAELDDGEFDRGGALGEPGAPSSSPAPDRMATGADLGTIDAVEIGVEAPDVATSGASTGESARRRGPRRARS